MRQRLRFGVLATVVTTGALVLSGGSAMAAAPSAGTSDTCAGGAIPSGTDASITVTGVCWVEANAVISVVGKNVMATGANTVPLNGIEVGGNVTLTGGGADIPWSIKNNVSDGNLTVSGQTVEWLGVLFNTIGRNATLTNITLTEDHDGASMQHAGAQETMPFCMAHSAAAARVEVPILV